MDTPVEIEEDFLILADDIWRGGSIVAGAGEKALVLWVEEGNMGKVATVILNPFTEAEITASLPIWKFANL